MQPSTEDGEPPPVMVRMEGVDGLTELHLKVAFDDGQNGGEIEEIVWKEAIALVTFKDAKGVCMQECVAKVMLQWQMSSKFPSAL